MYSLTITEMESLDLETETKQSRPVASSNKHEPRQKTEVSQIWQMLGHLRTNVPLVYPTTETPFHLI